MKRVERKLIAGIRVVLSSTQEDAGLTGCHLADCKYSFSKSRRKALLLSPPKTAFSLTQDIPRCTTFQCCSVILDQVPASSCQNAPVNTRPTLKSALCRGHSRSVSFLSPPPHSNTHTHTHIHSHRHTRCAVTLALKRTKKNPSHCTYSVLSRQQLTFQQVNNTLLLPNMVHFVPYPGVWYILIS